MTSDAARAYVKQWAETGRLLDDLRQVHNMSFHWIRGHNEHPENERCDELAVAARDAQMR